MPLTHTYNICTKPFASPPPPVQTRFNGYSAFAAGKAADGPSVLVDRTRAYTHTTR